MILLLAHGYRASLLSYGSMRAKLSCEEARVHPINLMDAC